MRVNGGEGDVDHFNSRAGKTLSQQNLKISARSISRLRITEGCRLAEYENSKFPRRFDGFHEDRFGFARNLPREEPQPKFFILNEVTLISDFQGLEKAGWKTITAHSQRKFHDHQH